MLKRYNRCIRCNNNRIYRVRGKKYKCYNCKYEWSIRKDSILYGLKKDTIYQIYNGIEAILIVITKLVELALSYTNKIFTIIREKIYIIKGEVEIDEAYFMIKKGKKR